MSTRSETAYAPGRYDTRRDSRSMVDRWREDVEAERIREVRQGYLCNSPPFYRDSGDWPGQGKGGEA